MRKQTKLVAVLSAAALLAIGASMTSFAGWEKNEAGQWTYTDKDGDLVTNEWQKDGGQWFYLDEDGIMATDQWIDGEKYVAEDGHMLKNEWHYGYADDADANDIDNEEHWWYFNNKGVLVTAKTQKYNGKQYRVDETGAMVYGWWSDGTDLYYYGDENDGARTQSQWLWLEKPSTDDETCTAFVNDDDADEAWYYFQSSGKAVKATTAVKGQLVNGKRYYFNQNGQMIAEWVDMKDGVATAADADTDVAIATSGQMRYAEVEEIGSRVTGWRQIEDPADTVTRNEVGTHWYYFKDGKAYAAAATNGIYKKEIKWDGKKGTFLFDYKGIMKTGFVWDAQKGIMYYADDNGYMKTGKITVDGDSYNFISKNSNNGQGINGAKDGYLYVGGKRVTAEDSYKLVSVGGNTYLVNSKGALQKSATKKYKMDDDRELFFSFGIAGDKYVVTAQGDAKNPTGAVDAVALTEVEIDDHTYTYDGNALVQVK